MLARYNTDNSEIKRYQAFSIQYKEHWIESSKTWTMRLVVSLCQTKIGLIEDLNDITICCSSEKSMYTILKSIKLF